MFQLTSDIIHQFRGCFKRQKTWRWFAVLVIGLMFRSDHRGVTSVISSMRLMPRLYHAMLHYFRSTAYSVKGVYQTWIGLALKYAAVVRIAGRVVVLGDHSKVPKEGLHMPGIQILHQDSQNSGKPGFIAGHNFGQVSAVIDNGSVSRSLPLITQMQKSPPKQENQKRDKEQSLVAQMLALVHETALSIKEPVVAALDAYFSSEVAWSGVDKTMTAEGTRMVEIVTRGQTNTVAFTVPEPSTVKRRGQPRKYGNKITLYKLFADMTNFKRTKMILYGKKTDVAYLCLDLIWLPVKKLVRFVLAETNRGRCVLMSSSLSLTPEEIITIYALRFKIETSFDEQKNDVGCFAYHFWTAALPKRKKWKKAEDPSDKSLKQKVDLASQAIESFVCLGTVATGILTLIAFCHNREIWQRYAGWLRTRRLSVPTAATVKSVFVSDFYVILPQISRSPHFRFLDSLLRPSDSLYRDVA